MFKTSVSVLPDPEGAPLADEPAAFTVHWLLAIDPEPPGCAGAALGLHPLGRRLDPAGRRKRLGLEGYSYLSASIGLMREAFTAG